MALEMRPDCERCGRDLPPGSRDAFICSFECTFCADCVAGPLDGKCPNCGGNLERRPTRAEALLAKYPASTERKGPA
jgi:hypothetical protein